MVLEEIVVEGVVLEEREELGLERVGLVVLDESVDIGVSLDVAQELELVGRVVLGLVVEELVV